MVYIIYTTLGENGSIMPKLSNYFFITRKQTMASTQPMLTLKSLGKRRPCPQLPDVIKVSFG